MSNMYSLTGIRENEDWIVTHKKRLDLSFSTKEEPVFLSASLPVIILSKQLPLAWLKRDPGFKILLRDKDSNIERDWIYHPMSSENKNKYQLSQKPSQKVERVLVVLDKRSSHSQLNQFVDHSIKRWDKDEILFIGFRHLLPKLDVTIQDPYLFCFQSSWCPDLIVFNQGQLDFSPFVMHGIHLGGRLADIDLKNDEQPNHVIRRWYGEWELYDK